MNSGISKRDLLKGHLVFICQHPEKGRCFLDMSDLDFSLDNDPTHDRIRKLARDRLRHFYDHMDGVHTLTTKEVKVDEDVYEVIQFEPIMHAFWDAFTIAAEAANCKFIPVEQHELKDHLL